ncbi:hypothetical protein DFP72DRAFT_927075 [Ephemerocybe angulata]|uniref:Uncharacterized protein n=1 Tax=Ephemerocybe angulata TaxID=980116 RepID=A0A8H6LXS8_9AGAR|nr:hypothetical protein DFP72DRAFT_927075 [Tulosesus angulatus]
MLSRFTPLKNTTSFELRAFAQHVVWGSVCLFSVLWAVPLTLMVFIGRSTRSGSLEPYIPKRNALSVAKGARARWNVFRCYQGNRHEGVVVLPHDGLWKSQGLQRALYNPRETAWWCQAVPTVKERTSALLTILGPHLEAPPWIRMWNSCRNFEISSPFPLVTLSPLIRF